MKHNIHMLHLRPHLVKLKVALDAIGADAPTSRPSADRAKEAQKISFEEFEIPPEQAEILEKRNALRGLRIAQRINRGSILVSLGKLRQKDHIYPQLKS
jgi:hypothetical protein